MTTAYDEGRQAFKYGLGHDENPYAGFTEAHEEWSHGWHEEYGEWFYKDFTPEWFEHQ